MATNLPASADEESSADASIDPYERARTICLTQLSFAPRSRAHLTSVLARRNVPADISQAVLDRLTEVGLVDDVEYAAMWVRSRQRTKGLSRRALRDELLRNGIDREHVEEALAQIDDADEWATARALVERKAASVASLEFPAQVRRLVSMLARKGYSAQVAFDVVKQVLGRHTDGRSGLEQASAG